MTDAAPPHSHEASADEIEITERMIEAGSDRAWDLRGFDSRGIAREIYRAMEKVRMEEAAEKARQASVSIALEPVVITPQMLEAARVALNEGGYFEFDMKRYDSHYLAPVLAASLDARPTSVQNK